jgi:hypothetical protein
METEQDAVAESSESLEGEDPLTNSIPPAVILGAGDADADLAAEPDAEDAAEVSDEPEQE